VRLPDRLRAEGGLLAAATADADVPFTAEEAIREGELAHYGDPRVVRTDDEDLALLAGDHLYALGLAELAAAGDLDGIRRLAAVIARCAQAHAEGRPEEAHAAWEGM
jgi:hypothetical protein